LNRLLWLMSLNSLKPKGDRPEQWPLFSIALETSSAAAVSGNFLR
jgi:hypothetical protein